MLIKSPFSQKNIKALYYAGGYWRTWCKPSRSLKRWMKIYEELPPVEKAEIDRRVNYYCRNSGPLTEDQKEGSLRLGDLKKPNRGKVYFLDLMEYLRFFDPSERLYYLPGDIIEVPKNPTLLKSRPLVQNPKNNLQSNANSVLLNLNKVRHFTFIKDPVPFTQKKDVLICRNALYQANRIAFFKKYYGHPLADLGQVNTGTDHDEWVRPKMSMRQHLDYKFILCLEGNDVASNLKWVMSSGSLAVMPSPRYETWYMEGTLEPDVHYVHLKDDYSDLEEKLKYYIEHPAEAQKIVANAQAYAAQFYGGKVQQRRETLTSLLVLKKYFGK